MAARPSDSTEAYANGLSTTGTRRLYAGSDLLHGFALSMDRKERSTARNDLAKELKQFYVGHKLDTLPGTEREDARLVEMFVHRAQDIRLPGYCGIDDGVIVGIV